MVIKLTWLRSAMYTKDEPDTFDFVKVNVLDDKTRNGNNCTVRYKGVSFCMTKENMDLVFEFIQRIIMSDLSKIENIYLAPGATI